ncbi:MAG: alginate export family protein [Deltaproteobacteria bacterium]|nr:alginate export family protein [Deltaproteobacteria bacterium]
MKRILLSVFAAAITAAWVVPVSAADVTFSGQYRLRGEYRNNADFTKSVAAPGSANDHNDFWDQRVRLTANAKATDDTTVKITLQDSRRWGATQSAAGGPGLTDTGGAAVAAGGATSASNTLDLHESFVNVDNLFGAPVSFRAGRQELNYGDQRLVGSFGWSNNGRSFDALKLTYKSEIVDVDLFESKVRESTTTNTDQDFYGLYATVKAIPNNTLDLYVLGLRDNLHNTTPFGWDAGKLASTTVLGTAKEPEKLYTYGVRLNGAFQALDYTVEVPFQAGTVKTDSTVTNNYKFGGYAYAVKAGYALPTPVKVRVGAEYDFASGDKDGSTATADSKVKTFFNLFPTNHDKLGYMDQQAWRNVKAWNLNVKADVNEKLSLYAAYWNFKLAQKQDAWYSASNWNNNPTGIRAASATNQQTNIGNEIDLVASYKYNNAVSAELGYGRFSAGKFVKEKITATAGSEKGDQDFAYLMLTANF